MELQWPLIVFTTLVAWSVMFGTQARMAAFGPKEGAGSALDRERRPFWPSAGSRCSSTSSTGSASSTASAT